MKLIKLLFIFIFMVALGCAKKDESESVVQPDIEPPSAPSGLAAQESSGMIYLYWSKSPESDVVKYRLYRNNSSISNFPGKNLSGPQKISFKDQGYIEETGLSFADSDVITGSTYYYRVSAFDKNNNESNKSNQVVVNYKDHAAPAKPVGLTALTGTRKGEINLSWTANSESDFLAYNIYGANQGGGNFSFIAGQSANNYTVTGLIAGNNYFFRITALDNSNNESEYSSEVFCRARGDSVNPAAPSGLTALAGASKGQVNLSWTANTEADLAKYRVYQSASGTNYSVIEEITGQPPDTAYIVNGLTSSTYSYFKISAVDDSDNESDLSLRAGVTVP
ncbi:MAG: fibronectin type III domain-containing protein [bacterium]